MKTERLYYPALRWYEKDINGQKNDDSSNQAFDFLKDKIPQDLPDYWEEED